MGRTSFRVPRRKKSGYDIEKVYFTQGRKPKRKRVKNALLLMLASVFLLLFLSIVMLNKRILPSVLEISKIYSKNRINHAINNSMADILPENIVSADFYIQNIDNSGNISGLSINTVLVNKICSQLAVGISDVLVALEEEDIAVPMGTVMGIGFLAGYGPAYNVRIIPLGDAKVDYESAFTSVGINQVNFKIWLNIETSVRIVYPFEEKSVIVTRRVALVDTVFSGEIPQFYFSP